MIRFFADGATIFCGGPITAMAWLPTPHILLNCKQVLAVAVGKDFESKYFVNSNYSESCIIQFWDFDVLKKKVNTRLKSNFLLVRLKLIIFFKFAGMECLMFQRFINCIVKINEIFFLINWLVLVSRSSCISVFSSKHYPN